MQIIIEFINYSDAFDHDLMLSCLADIRAGKQTKIPEYDYKTNSRYLIYQNKFNFEI